MRDLNLGASSPERGAADCEPLPCPFCGRAPEQFDRASDHTASGHIWFLVCRGDGYSAHAHQHGDTRAEVVAKWNRRAPVVPVEEASADDGEYPPITLNECDSFERHAEHGAKADPSGEGVEYALIQPYDLVRFCHTVRELRAQLAALRADREDAERLDFLEAEASHDHPLALFRRNRPITRDAIDAARRSQGGEPNV